MKYFQVIILSLFCVGIVNAKEVAYKELLTANKVNVDKVSIGMSEAQVKSIMGSDTTKVRNGPLDNPWKIERLGSSTVYHYLTSKNPPFTPILEHQATPVLFKDGKVVGIGRAYIKQFRENTNANAAAPSSSKTIEERMTTLNNLLKSGAIDKPTYEKRKKEILSEI